MAVWIGEIDASTAIIVIYLTGTPPRRVSPVIQVSITQPAQHGVEILFANQKGIVLRCDFALMCREIQGNAVVEFDNIEMRESGCGAGRPSISARNRDEIC